MSDEEQAVRDRELLESACREQGFEIKEEDWFGDEGNSGRPSVRLGRWRVTDSDDDEDFDDEERSLVGDDEGELVACVVGAAKYGNERVTFSFTPDGMEVGEEVRPFDDVEPL